MTTTIKDVFIVKYVELEKELKTHISGDFFPPLDIDKLADIIFDIMIIFTGISTDAQYAAMIKGLMDVNNIIVTDEVFELVYPKIMEFVKWMKQLKI